MRTQPSLNVVPSSSASTSLESSSSPPSPTIFSSTSSSFTAPEECGSNASSKFSHSQPQSILRNDLRKARHYSTEHSENGMGAEYGPSKGVTFKNSSNALKITIYLLHGLEEDKSFQSLTKYHKFMN